MNKYKNLGFLIASSLILSACTNPFSGNTAQPSQSPQATSSSQANQTFQNPKKSAHYETNTPAHGATLAGVPINVVIDFNFDLAKPSEIKIEKDGKDYGQGETIIDANKLTLRRKMDSSAPNGVYTVNYNACWPDATCHDGHFQFAIDNQQSESFEKRTGFAEAKINTKDIMFEPKNIVVSRGTTVMWINNDSHTHYVNTDSHPAHTYILDMNSKALEPGDTYRYTFNQPGIYPYHCSAHAQTMTGNILVI